MAVSDFLENLSNPQTIGGIAGAVLGANSARSQNQNYQAAVGANPYDAQYQQLSQQLMGLTGELADTNNPQFQSRVKQREDEIMRQYEKQLRQQQAVEARRYGRTGMGMVNPERRDEAIARSLASFRSQAQAQARSEAMGEMVNAAKVGGQITAPVVNTGSQSQRARQVAGANMQNASDVGKTNAYLALAGQVLGPLLKGVDFKKMLGVTSSSQAPAGVQSSTSGGPSGGVPSFDAGMFQQFPAAGGDPGGMFDPGYGYGGGGVNMPSFDMGQFPAAGGDPGGMYDPGYGYAAPSGDFPTYGNDAGGTFDPGYGYANTFSPPQFDFPDFGGDIGGFFDPGYGY